VDRQVVRSVVRVRPLGDEVERGVLATGADMVDDDVPGQPEQPAPEGDAPRLVSRQRLQGLDEDTTLLKAVYGNLKVQKMVTKNTKK